MADGKVGREPSKALFEDGTYDLQEFHDVFLECGDPTEYKPAMQLIGSWSEWNRLKRDWKGFNAHISAWKEELEIKFRSEASAKINELSKGEDAKALQAAKWIAEGGWNKRAGAGRPSKADQKREARELAQAAATTKDEEDRMLRVINGGK